MIESGGDNLKVMITLEVLHMSILVTGGAGVIGATVVKQLVAHGAEVVVFDLRDDRSLLGNVEVPIECGDICDKSLLVRVMRCYGVEKIVHLAAVMPDWAQENPFEASRINTWGLVIVLEAAREAGIARTVFTSSKAVIGRVAGPHMHPDYAPVSEEIGTHPYNVYGATKLAAEVLGKQLALESGLDLTVLRLTSTYGPGKTVRHGKLGILSAIIEGAFRGESVRLPSGADLRNDFLYCKDIAQAVIKALAAPHTGFHLCHIGSGRLASLTDFVIAVRRGIPYADIEIGAGLDYGGGAGQYFRMDIQAARDILGYEPEYDVEKGVADYVQTISSQAEV